MALHLIHGPLNSGRTGLMLERVRAAGRRNPVIVAPTGESRFDLERELCPAGEAVLGPTVTTTRGLAEELARATGTPLSTPATARQRRALLMDAIAATDLPILGRSSATAGFAAECERQFSRLRSDGVEPERRRRDGVEDPYLDELMRLYAAYLERLERSSRDDGPGLLRSVTAALRNRPDTWNRRPVFLHGFDELTLGEIELIDALAGSCEVTVSLTYEREREALAARATLYEQLRGLGPAGDEATAATPEFTESHLLHHVERHFGEPDPPAHPDDGSIRTLRSAGRRGEARSIATEVRRLVADGVRPSEIAIATLDTAGTGRALKAALSEAGLGVALEAELDIASTAVGTAVATLIDAVQGERSAAAVLRHLRAGPYPSEAVDEAERTVRRDRGAKRADAIRAFSDAGGGSIGWMERLEAAGRDGAAVAAELAAVAVEAADPLDDELELRAAGTIRAACLELAELGSLTPRPAGIARLLRELRVRAWQGPAGERVRIASPHTLRATRFEHLFVASLQDSEFPRGRRVDPFLSADQRRSLSLPEEPDSEREDIYLFHVCLSRPTRGLWLSTRIADEDGRPEQPSPLIEAVEEMIEPGEAGSAQAIVRGLGEVAPPAAEATGETELARAVVRDGERRPLSQLGLDGAAAERLSRWIDSARTRARAARGPRPLTNPDVLAELAKRTHFGATTLERFAAHPYYWFIGHELDPEPLARDDDPLVNGAIVHTVLERLYGERPGDTARPRPETLGAWTERAETLIEQECLAKRLDPGSPIDIARGRLIELVLASYLRHEAGDRCDGVEPAMLEAEFGDGESASRAGLELGDWTLHGKIDRIDLTPDEGGGLLRDYKYSSEATAAKHLEAKGQLQLQLYSIALRELWGIEPLGAVYVPLRARPPRPRGILREDAYEGRLAGFDCSKYDRLAEEEFEQTLVAARRAAGDVVARMRAGRIDGDPIEDAYREVPGWAAIDRRPRKALEVEE